jgi:broad specificity phosphatase PhoE
MLHLLLVRHGETAANVERRFQGQHADQPLTERGMTQAIALSHRLAGQAFGHVYSSDLLRARQTAEMICQGRPLAVVETALLRELDFGSWDGLTYQQARQRDPESWHAWETDPLKSAPPGGETLAQLADCVRRFVEILHRNHLNETVLLVAHGGPLQVLLATSLGLPPTAYWQLRIDPGSLSELYLYPAGGMLIRLNERG